MHHNGTLSDLAFSGAEFAELLGVSRETVSRMVAKGILSKPRKEGRESIYGANSITEYVTHLKSRVTNSESRDEIEMQKLAAERDYRKAKARQEEIKLAELQGEYHRAEDVEAATGEMVSSVRARLLALQPSIVATIEDGDTPPIVGEKIKRAVHSVLNDMSQYRYNPAIYRRFVRERGEMAQNEPGEEEGL